MLDRSLVLGLRNQTVGCLWWGIAHKKKSGYMEWERERPSSFARALFLSNTAEERIESPGPSNPMKTQRKSRRRVSRFAIMVAKFLRIPDGAAVYVIWAAWIAVVIIIGIIVMLWR